MKFLKQYRLDFCLSQSELAGWIQVDPSRLSKAERNKWELTLPGLYKMLELEKMYAQCTPAIECIPARDKYMITIEQAQKMVDQCTREMKKQTMQLQQMKARYKKLSDSYRLLPPKSIEEDEHLFHMGKLQVVRMKRRLENCDPAAQELLMLKLWKNHVTLKAMEKYLAVNAPAQHHLAGDDSPPGISVPLQLEMDMIFKTLPATEIREGQRELNKTS